VTESNHGELLGPLLRYVNEELDVGELAGKITADSPLLELGVLDSIRTARLLAQIRSEYGLRIPPRDMTGENFRTVQAIAILIAALRDQAAAPVENR
jgi:peptidyl carrier protein